jgi:hypothetical protein
MATEYTAGMHIESKIPGGFLTVGPSREGALGCFARDSAGKPVLLTNSHVMFPHFIATPHAGIYQPDYSSCCSGGDKIATVVFDSKQIKDGKFKGGFKITLGAGVVPAPNDKGFTKTNSTMTCAETDCAIARLDPGVQFRNVLKAPGGDIVITGVEEDVLSVLGPKAGTTPAPEQYVRVFTPRSGGKLIFGTLTWTITEQFTDVINENGHKITPIFRDAFVVGSPELMEAAGTVPPINQFVILPRPKPIPGETDYTKFYAQADQMLSFDHGDSGSVVVNHQGKVIAQIVGGFPFVPDLFVRNPADRNKIEFTSVGNVAFASPIRGILSQLQITIPTGGFAGTVPSAGESVRVFVPGLRDDPQLAADRQAAARLREGLRTSRHGKLLLGKIGQHRREVRELLTAVRAIAVTWRDLHGPAFYHHCVRSARDSTHIIPTSINGVTRDQLLEALLPLFVHYGSAALRRDIGRYSPWAREALLSVALLHDLPSSVARRRRAA